MLIPFPQRSDHVAYRAGAPEVVSRADVTGPDETVLIVLTAGPMACPAARRALLADDEFFPNSVRDDVVLLVTELVADVVRHANGGPGGAVRVELRRWADFVRIEVFDDGAGFTAEGPRKRDQERGGGLFLVDQIADRWGITPSGTCAWFEIRTSDERQATSSESTQM